MTEKQTAGGAVSAHRTHTVHLSERTSLDITGVETLDESGETAVTVRVTGGLLTVEGEGLTVRRLTPEEGLLHIDGKISAFYYTDDAEPGREKGFFSRLFR